MFYLCVMNENNQSISLFMEYEIKHDNDFYKNNWFQLMRVVEKIETITLNSLESSIIKYRICVRIEQNICIIYPNYGINRTWNIEKYTLSKIQSVFEAIIEFIDFYNIEKHKKFEFENENEI